MNKLTCTEFSGKYYREFTVTNKLPHEQEMLVGSIELSEDIKESDNFILYNENKEPIEYQLDRDGNLVFIDNFKSLEEKKYRIYWS